MKGDKKPSLQSSRCVRFQDVGSGAKSAELVADTAEALFTQAFNRNASRHLGSI